MKNIIILSLVVLTSFLAFKPKKQNWIPPSIMLNDCLNLPNDYFNYTNIEMPNYMIFGLENQDNEPSSNPVTDAGATLGRVLFYDKKLSFNNEVSCASCHLQEHGFSDPNQFSVGFEGGLTERNSMGLTHARYFQNGTFFWDERAESLEAQTLLPIQDPIEMGMNLADLEVKLTATEYYPPLFEDAFGTPTVSSERVGMAIAQFVRSIESYNSKYDLGREQVVGNPGDPAFLQPFPNFTEQENLGKEIFFTDLGNCNACHNVDLFVAPISRNNGLEIEYEDNGIGAANGNPMDNGKFKVTSLRNVGLTAPYMHDGRFFDLDEVIQHYDNGVLPHPNLAPQLKVAPNGPPKTLGLDQTQKDALVAFLHTLTDSTMMTDERWSNPFCIDTNTDNFVAEKDIEVFPNPSDDKVDVVINNELIEIKKLQIISADGNVLMQSNISGKSIEINRGNLNAGIYYIKLIGHEKYLIKRVVFR